MAEVKNRKTLGIKYLDENYNSKTFSIGYINPDNTDGVNKQLAEKIMSLSAGSGTEYYTTTVENITQASTDTTVTGFVLASTSDFFSTDSTTYAAAAATLNQSVNPNIMYWYSYSGYQYQGSLQYRYVRQATDFSQTLGAINGAGFNSVTAQTYFTAELTQIKGANAIKFTEITPGINIEIGGDPNVYNADNAAAVNIWVNSVWDGLVRVDGYEYELFTKAAQQEVPLQCIRITRA